MAWKLAPALDVLRREVNEAWPTRNIASDGTIGDAAHRSRPSHHNPDRDGIVRAIDLTHDPDSGADMNLVVGRVVGQRDHRIEYVIWGGQIIRSYKRHSSHPAPWTPEPYSGTNPHTRHAHFSVTHEGRFDTQPWHIERHDTGSLLLHEHHTI